MHIIIGVIIGAVIGEAIIKHKELKRALEKIRIKNSPSRRLIYSWERDKRAQARRERHKDATRRRE